MELLKEDILAREDGASAGKIVTLYEWSVYPYANPSTFHLSQPLVSKATLDIISLTAFGYKVRNVYKKVKFTMTHFH